MREEFGEIEVPWKKRKRGGGMRSWGFVKGRLFWSNFFLGDPFISSQDKVMMMMKIQCRKKRDILVFK